MRAIITLLIISFVIGFTMMVLDAATTYQLSRRWKAYDGITTALYMFPLFCALTALAVSAIFAVWQFP